MAEWRRRCGGLLPDITVVLAVLWVFPGSVLIAKSSTLAPACSNVTDSTDTCCLCTDPISCQGNLTCPDGYQPYNDTANICREQETSGTNQSTTEMSVPNDISAEAASALCYQCDSKEFFNGTNCVECDQLCLRCTGVGSHNCDLCQREYKGVCVEACPNDTVEVVNDGDNGVRCAENATSTGDDNDDKGFPIAIVGGAVGGGVVLIVIVLVVVILCWRRRNMAPTRGGQSTSRTAMSEIIEDRSVEDNKKPERQKEPAQVTKRKNYENQPDPGANFGRDIQNHGEKMLRYVQDPTNTPNKAKAKVSKEDDMDIYANSPAILMQKTLKGETVLPERLQEQLDKHEIDQLPPAPRPPVAAKTKGTKTEERESYIDMNNTSLYKGTDKGHANRKTKTQKAGVEKGEAMLQESDDQEQEVYENLNTAEDESDKEDYENVSTLKRKQQNKDTDQLEELDGPQEDYENFAFDNGSEIIAGKDDKRSDAVGQVRDMSDDNPDDGEESSQEDYENAEKYKTNIVTTDETRRDNTYENVKFQKK